MANNQRLNPAGYLINDNPMNTNPFFDWGSGGDDPTLEGRVQTLETSMAEANEDIADLENAMAAIPETYATQTQLGQGLSNLNTGIQQQINGISERFDNYYTKTQTYNKSEVDNLIPDTSTFATKTELATGLSTKADISDIPDVSNLATKTELTNGLATKANINDIPDMTNYYTKTQTDALIPDMSDYYTKTQVDDLIPDLTNYYTKSETNALIPDMANYYNKSQSYSKTEIDNMIGAAITALEAI